MILSVVFNGKKRGTRVFFGSMFVLERRHARLASLAVRGTQQSFPICLHLWLLSLRARAPFGVEGFAESFAEEVQ